MTAALCALLALAAWQPALAGVVVDTTGAIVPGAHVRIVGTSAESWTGPDGTFVVESPLPAVIAVDAPGFAARTVRVTAATAQPLRIVLEPRGISEAVTVSAGRDLRLAMPGSVTVLDGGAIASAPALAIDDQLRSVPGFSLYRRSSSRVANPTTQGVTLRGMAASGPSRTAVLVDDVPLTDAFGGWVQWARVPAASVDRVEVARGGASDIYGDNAVGGAVRLATARTGARLFLDAGSQGTVRASAFGGLSFTRGTAQAGAERFTTDGYVIVAPESRGAVDVPATSAHTSAYGGVTLDGRAATLLDIRGGYLDESRGNGTPFQVNATEGAHLSGRISGPVNGGVVAAHVYGAATDYAQTFSAVSADRATERPTSRQAVDSTHAGFSVSWLQAWKRSVLLVDGSAREVRAELSDLPLTVPGPAARTDASQRSGAVTAQVSLPAWPRVTLAGGLRAELWRAGRRGEAGHTAFNLGPRASVAFQRTAAHSVRVALQSGYRFPTMNELYRDFRVGGTVTRANAGLRPERSLGIEVSTLYRRNRVTTRLSGFWTALDHAIVNVTLGSDGAAIVRERRNAASIRARGVELEGELGIGGGVGATIAAVVLDSTFTSGAALEGLRVPQVPRASVAAGLRGAWRRLTAAAEWRVIASQFDDDRNQFELRSASAIDLRAAWRLRRGIDIFVAVENALDEEQDVGRTPLRTIGLPRAARVGLRLLR